MSLDQLILLVPPPKSVPDFDFGAVETAIGHALPDDYKRLVSTYGSGSFGGYLAVMAPTQDELVSGGAYCRQSLTDLRHTYANHSWIYPDGSTVPMVLEDVNPVPYYGWGGAPGGETGYWHVDGDDPKGVGGRRHRRRPDERLPPARTGRLSRRPHRRAVSDRGVRRRCLEAHPWDVSTQMTKMSCRAAVSFCR